MQRLAVRGQVKAARLFETRGALLHACVEDGELKWLVHEDGRFVREDGKVDPHEDIARSIHAATYFPQTIYYDRNGKIVFDHAGPYESAAALEKDIRRYALR